MIYMNLKIFVSCLTLIVMVFTAVYFAISVNSSSKAITQCADHLDGMACLAEYSHEVSHCTTDLDCVLTETSCGEPDGVNREFKALVDKWTLPIRSVASCSQSFDSTAFDSSCLKNRCTAKPKAGLATQSR